MHALRAAAATAVFVFAAAGALRPLTRAGFASPPLRRPSRARLSAAGDDWLEAELSIRALSDAGLGPEATVRGVVRSLQFIDEPSPNAGLERVFDRFTWECRKAVTARMGADTVAGFVEHGVLAPKLQYFTGAAVIEFGDATELPAAPPTRGAMYLAPVRVHANPAMAVAYASGVERGGVAMPPVRSFVICLRQERRPPLEGVWRVHEVLDSSHAEGDSHLDSV